MKLTFTDTVGVDPAFSPAPARLFLPDWYKKTPPYITQEEAVMHGITPQTVKKCIPVFDAVTAGYVITTCVDVQVTHSDGLPFYQCPSTAGLEFHPVFQAPNHPSQNGAPYPKWVNPWAVNTPPGYSCLFIPPMHNPNGIFTILPGVVDTDTYNVPVNFPFTLDDVKWEGLIPAGTPMVQVIPFRRDSWKMEFGGEKEITALEKTKSRLIALLFNSYKRQFWSHKEYR